jgi:hypothetical protein
MAARILAERQFQQNEDLWQRFVAWLDAHLHVQVPSLFGGTWETFVVLAVLVAAASAVVFLAVRNGSLRRIRPSRRTGVVVTDEDRAQSAEQWRYRALVAELADLRLIDEVPGRTSGDYERAVRALVPEAAEQFSAVTRLFERCWYGQEASDAKAQVVFNEAARAVIAEVGSGRWKALAKEAGRGSGDLVGLK